MKQAVSENKLYWVERASKLMDEEFRLPGTNFRFGIDPILNLIPVAGDISGFLISILLVLTMARHGASRKIVILMTLNVLLDATIGAIPLIGQLFDFVYKANTKNIRLLKEHYIEGKHQGSGTGIIITVLVVAIAFLIFIAYLSYKLMAYLIHLF
ncbi:DUF4112 domain-containing protein [Pedobacter sp. HMF7647]|uniref:DUF4112 domain-containing protein n=1 Tax=Hufsiella arboris TaxID=2695275 RepID=A0A7K1Y7D6_9SPHI|nr:DUF4112 domain-containing protein [Hufsiella arboris]MXV49978.1 DUF4112 domain-containing protein [Hufsiella arboris]